MKKQKKHDNSSERRLYEQAIIDGFLKLYQTEGNLNVKADKILFNDILSKINASLTRHAKIVASDKQKYEQIHRILDNNPVPGIVKDILTPEYRIFCLALNALKQWLSKKQAATDAKLLGSTYRTKLRKNISRCIVTNKTLQYQEKGKVNYHHPMRDGRPPIPLSKQGHDEIENQLEKITKGKTQHNKSISPKRSRKK